MSEIETRKFVIDEKFYRRIADRIDALNKKADKIRIEKSQITILSEELVPIDSNNYVKKLTIEISNQPFKYDGWSFIGVIQHTENGNILRLFQNISIPENYKTDPPTCEHCNFQRNRKDTYVVKHENGEFKRIGRNCLKDFTGHPNILLYASYIEELSYLYEDIDEYISGDYKEEDFYATSYINKEKYMAAVNYCIHQYGWLSKRNAEETGKIPTSYEALELMYNRDFDQKDYDESQKAIDWAKQISEDKREYNNYLHNVWVIAQKNCFEQRDLGIAASIIPLYQKETLKINQEGDYVGTIGERKEFNLIFKNTYYIYSDFSMFNIHIFQDENGNTFVWKTSVSLALEQGEIVKIKGTISEHNEYNGVKQTILKRCKIL